MSEFAVIGKLLLCIQIVNKLLTTHEQVINKSLTEHDTKDHEQVLNKL